MEKLSLVLKVLRDEDNDFKFAHIRDREKSIILGTICLKEDSGYAIYLNLIDITLPVLIHECLHGVYPDKSESWIRKETNELVAGLTRRQRKKIFFEWLCRISEVEDEE